MNTILIDIVNVCRLCLQNDDGQDEMILIQERPDIVNIIQRCVQIEVKLDSNQPTKICKNCVSYLDIWNRYKMVCDNNERLIQDCIQINESCLNVFPDVLGFTPTQMSPLSHLNLEFFENNSPLNDILQQSGEVMDTTSIDLMASNYANKVQPPEDVLIETVSGEEHIDKAGSVLIKNDVNMVYKKPRLLNSKNISMSRQEEKRILYKRKCTSTTGIAKKKKKYKQDAHKSYNCEFCVLWFTKFNDLIAHDIKVHTPISKNIICKKCGKCFLTNGRLKLHMQFHREKAFECAICQKKYTSRKTLNAHINVHEGIYHCRICDFKAPSPGALKSHENRHLSVKKQLCQVCLRNYSTPSSLRRHRLSHDNIVLYQCDQCDYSTDNSTTLKFHKFIHTSDSLVCQYCSRTFKNQNLLQSHSKIHTDRVFKCNNCPKTFRRKASLSNHLSKVHK